MLVTGLLCYSPVSSQTSCPLAERRERNLGPNEVFPQENNTGCPALANLSLDTAAHVCLDNLILGVLLTSAVLSRAMAQSSSFLKLPSPKGIPCMQPPSDLRGPVAACFSPASFPEPVMGLLLIAVFIAQ